MIKVDVDVPDIKAPDSGDVVEKGTDLGNLLADKSGTFWAIILCLVAAAVVVAMLKRPFVRGLAIGAIVLIVISAAFFK